MEKRRDVFQAIADPTRREIMGLLIDKPLNVNAIAEKFDNSRSTISGHLKILVECGLVLVEKSGRERVCRASFEELATVSTWLEPYRIFWNRKLDAMEDLLENDMD